MSWQALTENSFWQKFTTGRQLMSYTAICEALKEECMATDERETEQAKVEHGEKFDCLCGY